MQGSEIEKENNYQGAVASLASGKQIGKRRKDLASQLEEIEVGISLFDDLPKSKKDMGQAGQEWQWTHSQNMLGWENSRKTISSELSDHDSDQNQHQLSQSSHHNFEKSQNQVLEPFIQEQPLQIKEQQQGAQQRQQEQRKKNNQTQIDTQQKEHHQKQQELMQEQSKQHEEYKQQNQEKEQLQENYQTQKEQQQKQNLSLKETENIQINLNENHTELKEEKQNIQHLKDIIESYQTKIYEEIVENIIQNSDVSQVSVDIHKENANHQSIINDQGNERKNEENNFKDSSQKATQKQNQYILIEISNEEQEQQKQDVDQINELQEQQQTLTQSQAIQQNKKQKLESNEAMSDETISSKEQEEITQAEAVDVLEERKTTTECSIEQQKKKDQREGLEGKVDKQWNEDERQRPEGEDEEQGRESEQLVSQSNRDRESLIENVDWDDSEVEVRESHELQGQHVEEGEEGEVESDYLHTIKEFTNESAHSLAPEHFQKEEPASEIPPLPLQATVDRSDPLTPLEYIQNTVEDSQDVEADIDQTARLELRLKFKAIILYKLYDRITRSTLLKQSFLQWNVTSKKTTLSDNHFSDCESNIIIKQQNCTQEPISYRTPEIESLILSEAQQFVCNFSQQIAVSYNEKDLQIDIKNNKQEIDLKQTENIDEEKKILIKQQEINMNFVQSIKQFHIKKQEERKKQQSLSEKDELRLKNKKIIAQLLFELKNNLENKIILKGTSKYNKGKSWCLDEKEITRMKRIDSNIYCLQKRMQKLFFGITDVALSIS